MPTWYTHTHLTLPAPLAEDSQLLDLTEHLTNFGVSASVTPDNLARITISLAIQANDHLEATTQATTLQTTGPLAGAQVTTLTVRTEQDMEEYLNAPSIPELVGLTDIAGMAGVSRQRVRDLSIKDPAFPPVAVNTGTMSLYLKASAEHWAADRHPTTGRPKTR